MSISRSRVVYSLAATIVLLAGLGSRSGWRDDLPSYIGAYAGDTLWSLLLYLLMGTLLPKINIWKLATGILAFTFAVEFSQLYQEPWITHLRENPLGALALGKSFVWSDLPCYTAGVVLGVAIDLSWQWISEARHVHAATP